MSEQQKKIFIEVQNRITLLSEGEFLWIISTLGVDGCDDQGNTFLHMAAAKGFEKACKEILLAGHNSECPNGIGKTPATLALENGHLDLALFIKSAGKDDSQSGRVSPANNNRNQSCGTFDPTPSTRLMDADPEWLIPEDLREPMLKSDVTYEFEAGEELEAQTIALSEKLNAARINPLHSSLILYLRLSELIRNIYFCNRGVDDEDIFISWVEQTLEGSEAISGFANRIASETYALRSKMHERFASLGVDITNLIGLLEWVKRTSESQSIRDRAAKIEKSLEVRMSELRDLTSEALGVADDLTSVNIEKAISSNLKNELMHDAKQWMLEYGRKTEVLDQICRIVEDDLFSAKHSADFALLNPSRRFNLAEELFEQFAKYNGLEDWDNKREPQWSTSLWSFDGKH
jgi:hypothetical protein